MSLIDRIEFLRRPPVQIEEGTCLLIHFFIPEQLRMRTNQSNVIENGMDVFANALSAASMSRIAWSSVFAIMSLDRAEAVERFRQILDDCNRLSETPVWYLAYAALEKNADWIKSIHSLEWVSRNSAQQDSDRHLFWVDLSSNTVL